MLTTYISRPGTRHIIFWLGSMAAIMFLSACAFKPDKHIRDLSTMPQQPSAYLQSGSASAPLLDTMQQQDCVHDFLARHFRAWNAAGPLAGTTQPFWAFEWWQKPVYGLNLMPVPATTKLQLRQDSAPEQYPACAEYAITLENVDIRALPTSAPMFNDPSKPGEGYPFDLLQHGVLPAATPVLITHRSKNGAWAFVESELMYGWVPATRLAKVGSVTKAAFTRDKYVVMTRDDVAVHNISGAYRFTSRIGTILPLLAEEKSRYRVLIPGVDAKGCMIIESAYIDKHKAQTFPLPFTPSNVAALADQFMEDPYSWGDRYSGRDCSATMRDLFAPFGVWLPRNSGHQAQTGRILKLRDDSPAQRRKIILQQGVPFATLVHLPGHIMLYLGSYEGEPAVLHALWGLKTRSVTGGEQRLKIGRTVITSLEPGLEHSSMFNHVSSLLERIDSMNIPAGAPEAN